MNVFLATLIALPVLMLINFNAIVAEKDHIFFLVDVIKIVH
jgi:hypothetical protein